MLKVAGGGVSGALSYQSTWDASTNTPFLQSSVGTKGFYYVVNVAGTTNLDGINSWAVGDWAVFNGSVWQKVDNTDAVVSVNGYTGAVSLVTSDIPESGNLYFTNARVTNSLTSTTANITLGNVIRIVNYTYDQMQALTGAQKGWVVFETSNNVFRGYNGTSWSNLG